MQAMDTMWMQAGAWWPKVASALVIAGLAVIAGRAMMAPIAKLLRHPARGRMLGRYAAVLVWGLGAAAALRLVGVPASITLPILGTVLVFVGAVLALAIGPNPPACRAGGSAPAGERVSARHGKSEVARPGRANALSEQGPPHDRR